MEKQEFFLLIPAIIYGVAMVDLLKIFQHKKSYWEVVSWGILLFMIIINSWIELYQKLGSFVDNNINFYLIIGQAIMYAQTAYVITPEEKDADTKQYFHSVKKLFFLLLAGTIIVNVIIRYAVFDDDRAIWLRPLAVVLLLICAYVDKLWVRTIILTFVFTLAMLVIFSDRLG